MSEEILCEDNRCAGKYNHKEYSDVVKISGKFVDSLIDKAVRTVGETENDRCWKVMASDNHWPTCGLINIQNAGKNIEKLMNEWKSVNGLEEWMFHVEFISLKADQTSDFYFYEVKWSIPTPEYPIPQVTASVFFSIEASRIEAKSYPVDVTYVFEGTQFVHRSEIPFQQKWLYDILDVKTLMFKSFKF